MDEAEWIGFSLMLLGGIVIGAWIVYALGSSPSLPTFPVARTYQNVEEWEVKRDSGGRLIGITVHRDAEET